MNGSGYCKERVSGELKENQRNREDTKKEASG